MLAPRNELPDDAGALAARVALVADGRATREPLGDDALAAGHAVASVLLLAGGSNA